jgi:hypothetical protein
MTVKSARSALCPAPQVEVLVHVVSALFDMNPSMASHMAPPLWRRCAGVLLEVLGLLRAHPNIVMDEHYEGAAEERCEWPPALRLIWHGRSALVLHLLVWQPPCCCILQRLIWRSRMLWNCSGVVWHSPAWHPASLYGAA